MAGQSKRKPLRFDAAGWLTDPVVRMAPYGIRGLAVELLCLLHQSSEYGRLEDTSSSLARLLGCDEPTFEMLLASPILKHFGIGVKIPNSCHTNVTPSVTLVSHYMAKERIARENAAERQRRSRASRACHASCHNPHSSSNIYIANSYFRLTRDQHDSYVAAYPLVDCLAEYKKMKVWLDSNPKKRKKDYPRFINNWLSRVQKQAEEKRGNGGYDGIRPGGQWS